MRSEACSASIQLYGTDSAHKVENALKFAFNLSLTKVRLLGSRTSNHIGLNPINRQAVISNKNPSAIAVFDHSYDEFAVVPGRVEPFLMELIVFDRPIFEFLGVLGLMELGSKYFKTTEGAYFAFQLLQNFDHSLLSQYLQADLLSRRIAID